jgi:hypothetical protein
MSMLLGYSIWAAFNFANTLSTLCLAFPPTLRYRYFITVPPKYTLRYLFLLLNLFPPLRYISFCHTILPLRYLPLYASGTLYFTCRFAHCVRSARLLFLLPLCYYIIVLFSLSVFVLLVLRWRYGRYFCIFFRLFWLAFMCCACACST